MRLTLRVAARYQLAYEFPSPEALKDYLHEHPGADPSKHTVRKHEAPPRKPEEAPPGGKTKRTWKDLAKGLSEKARGFLSKAPESVKKFVNDEGYRRQSLIRAHESITKAPEKFVKNAWDHAKHEVKEFKEAGVGVKNWMSGKEMTKEQKHAFRKVALHMATTVAAGALGAGLGAGAAAVTKGVMGSFISSTSKKVALKAVTRHLEHLPLFEELGHIGHSTVELFSEFAKLSASEPDPEEVLQMMIAAAVAKELKEIQPDSIEEALEEASGVESEG